MNNGLLLFPETEEKNFFISIQTNKQKKKFFFKTFLYVLRAVNSNVPTGWKIKVGIFECNELRNCAQ